MRRPGRTIGAVGIGVFAVILVVGYVEDGMVAWNVQHDKAGLAGTLTLERTVQTSVGRPPPITSWAGTYESDDGSVRRFAQLGESLPDEIAERPGSVVAVRWMAEQPDVVFLADGSRTFTNWVEGMVFLAAGLTVLLSVVLWNWRRTRRAAEE